LALTLPPEPPGVLRFPGKVLAVSRSRLFVADSGHDRILELEVDWGGTVAASPGAAPQARVVRQIGSGQRGAADGRLAEAQFDHPQGMALGRSADGGELLYVADSENHTIRAVDLPSRQVTTLVGTGVQARRSNQAGVGTSVALSSPWDVALLDGALIIAMAGTHQLWRLDLATLEATPWVGTGREDISDGPASRCTLAQPMGLSLARAAGAAEGGRVAGDGGRLYFADSESSAIRFVDLAGRTGPEVTTVVGRGLFEFGDQDGKGGHVRLQHPYAVAAHQGTLYVADTYNNKITRLSPDGRSETFAGTGEEGLRDGEPAEACFDEPQGLAVAGGVLFVADTNNHALRAVDLTAAGKLRVHTVAIAE
jgi:DNA-binding beta-propeller fold protein YncE